MSDRLHSPRRERETPLYDGPLPDGRPQQMQPFYDPSQRPKWSISFGGRGPWWVWLSIGIGLTVVASALFGGGGGNG